MENELYKKQEEQYLSYIGALRAKFDSLSLTRREEVLSRIENLLTKVLLDKNYHTRKFERKDIFAYEEARKTRKSLGISQTELAAQIGTKQKTISNLECGNCAPSIKKEAHSKYLRWLAEHGYNPFNLSF